LTRPRSPRGRTTELLTSGEQNRKRVEAIIDTFATVTADRPVKAAVVLAEYKKKKSEFQRVRFAAVGHLWPLAKDLREAEQIVVYTASTSYALRSKLTDRWITPMTDTFGVWWG
jgi:hypothetical protein